MSSRASAVCQDVYPVNAYDLELLPFEPFFLDVGDRGKFVLKLQGAQTFGELCTGELRFPKLVVMLVVILCCGMSCASARYVSI